MNLDQLITDSKRPLDAKDEKTEVKRRVIKKRKPLNVRGFKPGAGESQAPPMPEEMKEKVAKRTRKLTPPRKVAYKDGGVAESYADLTGVKVVPTEAALQRRKAMLDKAEGKVPGEETDELGEILEELEDTPAPKPTRRKRTPKKDA